MGNLDAVEQLNEDEMFFEQDPDELQEDAMRVELSTFKYNSNLRS